MKSIVALLMLLLSTTFVYANGDLIVTGKIGVGSTTSPSNTLQIAGTTQFADGAMWGSSGISDTSIYSTVSTPIINFSNTYNFSSTGSFSVMQFRPILVPAGASAGAMNALVVTGNIDNSSSNLTQMRALTVTPIVNANYAGTIGTYSGLLVNQLANNGTKPVTNSYCIYGNGFTTNGNALTSGTVNNYAIFASGASAAAGSGGTVNNRSVSLMLPTGSSSTTTNYGLHITGNGGAASKNYGIYNASTAPNYLAGNVGIGTSSLSGGSSALVFGPGAKPSTGAGLYGAYDANNKTIVKVFDESGNDHQISAHAQDAPEWLYDIEDGMPMIVKETQYFLGYVRYTNQTRAARLSGLTDKEKSSLAPRERVCVFTETFAEHESRTGEQFTLLIWEEQETAIKKQKDFERQIISQTRTALSKAISAKDSELSTVQDDEKKTTQAELDNLKQQMNELAIPQEYQMKSIPPRLAAALGR